MAGLFGFLYGLIVGGAFIKEGISDSIYSSESRENAKKNNEGIYIDTNGKRRDIKTNRIVTMVRHEGRYVYIDSLKYLDGQFVILADPDKAKAEEEDRNTVRNNDIKIYKEIRKAMDEGRRVIYLTYGGHKNNHDKFYDFKSGIYFRIKETEVCENGDFVTKYIVTWKNKGGVVNEKELTKKEYFYLLNIKLHNKIYLFNTYMTRDGGRYNE